MHNIVLLNNAETVTKAMLPDPLGLTGSAPPAPARAVRAPSSPTQSPAFGNDAIEPLWLVEKRTIEHAIRACDDNVPVAAAHLGVSASTLYRKLKAWQEQA